MIAVIFWNLVAVVLLCFGMAGLLLLAISYSGGLQ